ncbi:putative Methyltransferase involved in Williams Beuren syndrome [Trypanosoma vivax]|uniref:18S rRNA (guanine(1575)-N(7))-methyltransferase Bud23 C-terminal domain-containing protein n=1 Tax=Trypanosoma vivax (strain Y486) TaxID=1055687 RepID=G0TU66_TRYVY|nr:hypothetical protein TRVL_03451 [Trypanosoma vivax]KAH8613957.1 putative Methyltransferase involved in Williams Beuren syndrome [Trypanosoma vivax]CCC47500.1 conserved hypothetical protein [Trypanosoma vivax Y486]
MPPPRPEFGSPADVFYNDAGALRYTRSGRVQQVQRAMTIRALELLSLPQQQQAFLLDVGCGSGISGDVVRESGHVWVGVDISRDMLSLAKSAEDYHRFGKGGSGNGDAESDADQGTQVDLRNVKWGLIKESDKDESEDEEVSEREGDGTTVPGPSTVEVIRGDIGEGLPFRPASFDGAVSISAIQWLCQSDRKGHVPQRRLRALFQSLYNVLRRGAKAALQFYPANVEQVHMITRAAMLCGFSGGVVVDFPHSTKAKKHYLVVQAGQLAGGFVLPPPLSTFKHEHVESICGDDGVEELEESEDDVEQQAFIRVGGREQRKRPRSRSSGVGERRRRKDNRPLTGSRDWVLLKKAERRKFGLQTPDDTKYTMRKRRPRF